MADRADIEPIGPIRRIQSVRPADRAYIGPIVGAIEPIQVR